MDATDRMAHTTGPARGRYQVVIVGGGQAALALGRALSQARLRFVILDGAERIGEAWRGRWDSLRLFTPARYSALPGLPFPAPDEHFPTKDEVADYLRAYAAHFALPVLSGVRVTSVERDGEGYAVLAGGRRFAAGQVVIATGAHHQPWRPAFSALLDPAIAQVHSSAYKNPAQLPGSTVLVVGAGNSGAEIALDLARAGRSVLLAGRDTGRIPAARLSRLIGGPAYWWLISRFLSVRTPVGRRLRRKVSRTGAPLIGTSRDEVRRAGVRLLGRISGAREGQPQLASGPLVHADAVVWATGFRSDFSWVRLPIFDEDGAPLHERGQIPGVPGLYFLGLLFQSALTSNLLGGVGEDAAHLASVIVARAAALARAESAPPTETAPSA